ncbi:MAG: preprotein translocase subunit SecE [Defluviitaleaceae bacterium]|nr:preprotein translocase subunit SecE [Defluviitaleaceae bacterium]
MKDEYGKNIRPEPGEDGAELVDDETGTEDFDDEEVIDAEEADDDEASGTGGSVTVAPAAVASASRAPARSGGSGGKSKNVKDEKKESLFAEVNGEFKKIVWPPRAQLVKQTTTVVIVALMFGVIIFAMDTVFGFGITSFIDLMIG